VYPDGTGAGDPVAAVLAVAPPEAAADAGRVAEAVGFVDPGALLHDVMATPRPMTAGSARLTALVRSCVLSLVIAQG
jgi:hypothetical protein